MIEFNTNDFNLTKIRHETKLTNLTTRNNYNVYGLRQENNPPILIEFNYDRVSRDFNLRLKTLINFFKSNGIEVDSFNEYDKNTIDIGLRKDLRNIVNKNGQPLFASSILSTIIYCLEGRIDLDQMGKYKLTNIPKLSVNTEENLD